MFLGVFCFLITHQQRGWDLYSAKNTPIYKGFYLINLQGLDFEPQKNHSFFDKS